MLQQQPVLSVELFHCVLLLDELFDLMSILLKRLLGKVISTFSENPCEYARGRGYLT
jgi:hypothetical protein